MTRLHDFCQELLRQRELACPSALLSVSKTGAAPMASPHLKTGSMKTKKNNKRIEISAFQSATKQHPCAPQQQTITPAATDDNIQPTTTAPVSEENGAPSPSPSKTTHSTRRRQLTTLIRLSKETENELRELKSFYTNKCLWPTTAMSETTACRHV